MNTEETKPDRFASITEKGLNSVIFLSVLIIVIYAEKFYLGIDNSVARFLAFLVSWGIAYIMLLATVALSKAMWARGIFAAAYLLMLAYLLVTPRFT